MSGVDSATLVQAIPVLGRSISLGDLYNIHTCATVDNPVSGQNVTVDKAVKRDVTRICSDADKFRKLEVSKEHHLNILLGMVQISGSSGVLLLDEDKHSERVLLITHFVREKRSIEDDYFPEEQTPVTHRVISGLYGARIVFLFEASNARIEAEKLMELVQKIQLIRRLSDNGLNRLSQQERTLCQIITCRLYSDIPLGKHDTLSISEVVELYHQLPVIVNASEPVPLSVEISQLCPMTNPEIQADLVEKLIDFLSALRAFRKTCDVLINREILQKFPAYVERISLFREMVYLFEVNITTQMQQDILQQRRGKLGNEHFQTFLDGIDNSPFHMNVGYEDLLQNWVNEQKQVVDLLEKLKKSTEYKIMILNAEEAQTEIIGADNRRRVVLYLGASESEKKHLTKMAEYGAGWIPSDKTETVNKLQVYQTTGPSVMQTIRDFAASAEHDKDVLIVTEEVVIDSNEGQIRIYKSGEICCDNFLSLCRLEKPIVENVRHDRINIVLPEKQTKVEKYEVHFENENGEKTAIVEDTGAQTIVGFQAATVYELSVRALTEVGPGPYSPVIFVVTAPIDSPSKPEALQTSERGCLIRWEPPTGPLGAFQTTECLTWEVEIVVEPEGKMTIRGLTSLSYHAMLDPETTYRFRIRGVCRVHYRGGLFPHPSMSEFSAQSEPFQLTNAPERIAKNRSLMNSVILQRGNPTIRQLRLEVDHIDVNCKHRRLVHGPAHSTKSMKTILLVGATGAGKSTLINAFANYLHGVQFQDNYRFRIIDEERNADESLSQTKWVTAYVLNHQSTFPAELPYSLTIVDTPGFGDTSGIEADQKITEQLSKYFHARGHEGIDELDAIGFVVQASLSRLTPTQQYIFDSILALFGHDVKDNIFVMVTFADGGKPSVISALEKAKLPYTRAFKFNNSALYAAKTDNTEKAQANGVDSEDDDADDQSFNRNYWTMGAASYKRFLVHLSKAQPRSLVLTNQVLDERERLVAHVSGIQNQIEIGLAKRNNLLAGVECLRKHETDIDRNENFTYKVEIPKLVSIPLTRGMYVTNCLSCNRTCHYPCTTSENEMKWRCAVMTRGEGENATCRICPEACHWSVHRNTPERLVMQTETKEETIEDMRRQYEEACKEKLTAEQLILRMIDDIEIEETRTAYLVEEVRASLERLSHIALKPFHMTTVGYIDTLIQSEKQRAEPGWEMRVEQLLAVRERAEMTRRVAECQGIDQPWKALKAEIEANKHDKSAVANVFKKYKDKLCQKGQNFVKWFEK